VNNLPKVVTQQRRGQASNPRLLDRKSDALPLSHRAVSVLMTETTQILKRYLTHFSFFSTHFMEAFFNRN